MAAGNLHGSVQARKLEEKLAGRTELRTKLECKSRSELQSLAKMYGIAANLKSDVIIDGILKEVDKTLDSPYDLATYKECMEAVCLLMKKPGGAKVYSRLCGESRGSAECVGCSRAGSRWRAGGSCQGEYSGQRKWQD